MRAKTIYVEDGETVKVTQNWAAETEKRGTTVSSSAWEFSGAASLSGAALATPVASTLIAPTSCGELKNTATLANGEVLIALRTVEYRGAPVTDYV